LSTRPSQDFVSTPTGESLGGANHDNGLPELAPTVRSSTLRWMVVTALGAVFFGRAMAQALPGSRSGLGHWLDVNHWLAAFLSQLLAVLIVLVGGRLALMTSLDRRIDARHRLFIAPAASAVIFLLIFACVDFLIGPFAPEISLLLGIAGAGVALGGAAACAKPRFVRVGSLVLALVATASISQVTARLLALQAADAALPKQYAVSRWVATTATVLDLASLIIAGIWVVRRDRLRLPWFWYGWIAALAVGAAAHHGASSTATFAEVLIARFLAQLHRAPSAVFPRVLLDAQEVFALLLAAVLLWRPRQEPSVVRSCLALVLLARSSPDIPLCAGLLVSGALGLSTFAARSRPPEPERTRLDDQRNAGRAGLLRPID